MKPIFSRNIDIEKIAFLNWRISEEGIVNMINMAEGFMKSAIELSRLCAKDNTQKRADIFIFPILSSVNHGIELYLKAMVWTINIILQDKRKIQGRHNIKQIYDTLNAKMLQYNGQLSYKDFRKGTDELRDYITELFSVIQATSENDKMDFSRYPFSRDYQNHFYVDIPGNVEVDLDNFVERFESIQISLDNIASYLYWHELIGDW